LKNGGAKLQGLRLVLTKPASCRIQSPSTDYETLSGGYTMLPFIVGTLTGSIAMLFTMSLMFTAKRADEQSELMLNE
jgi:hypothetical protein